MDKKATRDGFGKGLLKLGEKDERIISVEADLAKSTRSNWFSEKFPDRCFSVGISEQDMISVSAGLASSGKIPFASTFAIFTERAFEQARNSVARPNLNVKIIGSHGGIHTGEDGSSAQAIEDFAIYRALPNFIVLCPADAVEAEKMTLELARHKGPAYMRLTRNKIPILSDEKLHFRIGKGVVIKDGSDAAVFACGTMVHNAIQAAEELEKQGISVAVVNMSTIKPIDKELVEKYARKTGVIVTAEDHNIIGGLGGAVCEAVCDTFPVPVERVGLKDTFAESGKPEELYEKYGLSKKHIAEAVKKIIKIKGK